MNSGQINATITIYIPNGCIGLRYTKGTYNPDTWTPRDMGNGEIFIDKLASIYNSMLTEKETKPKAYNGTRYASAIREIASSRGGDDTLTSAAVLYYFNKNIMELSPKSKGILTAKQRAELAAIYDSIAKYYDAIKDDIQQMLSEEAAVANSRDDIYTSAVNAIHIAMFYDRALSNGEIPAEAEAYPEHTFTPPKTIVAVNNKLSKDMKTLEKWDEEKTLTISGAKRKKVSNISYTLSYEGADIRILSRKPYNEFDDAVQRGCITLWCDAKRRNEVCNFTDAELWRCINGLSGGEKPSQQQLDEIHESVIKQSSALVYLNVAQELIMRKIDDGLSNVTRGNLLYLLTDIQDVGGHTQETYILFTPPLIYAYALRMNTRHAQIISLPPELFNIRARTATGVWMRALDFNKENIVLRDALLYHVYEIVSGHLDNNVISLVSYEAHTGGAGHKAGLYELMNKQKLEKAQRKAETIDEPEPQISENKTEAEQTEEQTAEGQTDEKQTASAAMDELSRLEKMRMREKAEIMLKYWADPDVNFIGGYETVIHKNTVTGYRIKPPKKR